jgi:TolB-like protein/Tfp pilus assembly protein PilF
MGLLSELKRRNVFRMAVLYALSSWLIMQVAEVLMTLAALPEWTGQATLVVLAIGFPIALVFSWFYELTPEGLSLEKEVPAGESITHLTGRRMDFIVIAVLSAALIVFAYDKWWISGSPITSVAVLPLADFGMESDQQYLADGMTEVLTAQLGQIQSLQVVSRTSAMHYKDTTKLLPQIAKELGVDAIVEGSLQPAGDKIRFTMQLVDGRTDRHLWARSYQRDLRDILTLQGEIARAIAREIQLTLAPETEVQLTRDRAADPGAVRLWTVGNHHMEKLDGESLQQALQAFREAADRDPSFAPAYAGIAHVYVTIGSWHTEETPESVLPLAKEAAETALRLDPYLADAHFALGMINWLDWQWKAALRDFQRSLELNPTNATGLLWYTNFLASLGRHEEAVETGMQAVRLDPLSPAAYNELAFALWFAGKPDEAEKQFEIALELDPDFWQTIQLTALFYAYNNQHDKALARLDKRTSEPDLGTLDLGVLADAYSQIGHTRKAQELLRRLQEMPESAKGRASALALAHLAVGEIDEALDWMDVAYDERDVGLIWSREYPAFDELRDNARFQDLIDRLNLPGQRDDIVVDDPRPNPETRLSTAVSQHFPTVIFRQNEEKVAISHNVDYCC